MGGLNASFIQGARAPEIDNPITTAEGISRLEQIRQQNALAPLRAQQMQGQVQRTNLENQVTQGQLDREAEDKAAEPLIQQALADNGGDWAKARPTVTSKISNRVLLKKDQDHLDYMKAMGAAGAERRKSVIENSDFLGRELNGVILTPEEDRQNAWVAAQQRAVEAGTIKAEDAAKQPTVPPIDDLKRMLAQTTYAGTAAKIADTQAQEDQRKTAASKAAAAARADEIKRLHSEAATHFLDLPPADDPTAKAAYQQKVKDFAALPDPEGATMTHAQYAKQFLESLAFSERAPGIIANRPLNDEQRQQNSQKSIAEQEATRRNDILQQRADANDRRIEALIAHMVTGGQAKPATKGEYLKVASTKSKTLADSQKQLDKDLRQATLGGITDPDAYNTAWQEHIERVQNAQRSYEEQTSQLTGGDVGHNDWADQLKAPALPASITSKGGKKGVPALPTKPAAATAPSVKSATMDQIQSYATKYNMSLDDAKAKAKADGYTINDEQ